MERSLGADALLNESWTIPWLDEDVFPYWPQAARIGDLEDLLRWLVIQDIRRAELILNHAREFERVHRLVTTELSKLEHHQQQHRQQQQQQHQHQQHRHREVQPPMPLASSTAERPGTRQEGVRGVTPSRSNASEAAAVPPFGPREPPAAARSKRPSSRSGGISIGGARERAALATNTPSGTNRSWPSPSGSTGAGKKKQYGTRNSRHEGPSGSRRLPPSLVGSSGSISQRAPASRPRATGQPPAWSSSTLSADASVKSAVLAGPRSRRATRQWNSFRGAVAQGSSGQGSSSSSSGGGSGHSSGLGKGSGGGTSNGSGRGSVGGGSRGLKAVDASAYWPGASGVRPAPSSWGAMAVAAAASAAAGRTAAVRLTVEAAAAEAEAEAAEAAATAAAKAARAERGENIGLGGPFSEEHPGRAGAGGQATRGAPRRSSSSIVRGQTNGDGTNDHGLRGGKVAPSRRPIHRKSTLAGTGFSASAPGRGFGEQSSPPTVYDVARAGNGSDSPRGAVGRRSAEQSIQFLSSTPRLNDIDEERAEEPVEVAEAAAAAVAGEKEDGESWLSMRDPVTLREFRFDPETRAAEWEGGEVMGDVPGGMGLGLLSQEDRERLKGKFERRKRRVRRASGAGGGGGGGGAGSGRGGHNRGTPGLRAQVLRKLALGREDGEAGSTRAAEAALAVATRRGAAATA